MFEKCKFCYRTSKHSKSTKFSEEFPKEPSAFKWQIMECYPYISLISVSAPVGEVTIFCRFSIGNSFLLMDELFTGNKNGNNKIMGIKIATEKRPGEISTLLLDQQDSLFHDNPIMEIRISALLIKYENKNQTTPDKYFATLLPSVLKNSDFCDLTIQVGSSNFKAHKCILAAISPVFQAMLLNNMKEKESSCIVIKGFESDIIQQMIHFIYHGVIDPPDFSTVTELLKISDVYNIESLKYYCTNQIESAISNDNVLQIILQADLCNAEDLKKFAINYLVQNMKIYSPDAFEEILNFRPQLFPELLSKVSEKLNEK